MADGFHTGLPAQVKTPSSSDWRTIQRSRHTTKSTTSDPRTRSRTPVRSTDSKEPTSPPNKKQHVHDQDSDSDSSEMHIEEKSTEQTAPLYSFLLSNFDSKFQNPKQLLQQFSKYVPRQTINN